MLKRAILSQNEMILNGISPRVKMAIALYDEVYYYSDGGINTILERDIATRKLTENEAEKISSAITVVPTNRDTIPPSGPESDIVFPIDEIVACVQWSCASYDAILDTWLKNQDEPSCNHYMELHPDPFGQPAAIAENIFKIFGLYRNIVPQKGAHDIIAHNYEVAPIMNRSAKKPEYIADVIRLYSVDFEHIRIDDLINIKKDSYRSAFWDLIETAHCDSKTKEEVIVKLNKMTMEVIRETTPSFLKRIFKLAISQIPIASQAYDAYEATTDYCRYKKYGGIMFLNTLARATYDANPQDTQNA